MSLLYRMSTAAVAAASVTALGLAMTPAASAVSTAPVTRPVFLAHFHKRTTVASTVPRNRDVNPYGVAVVRHSQGRLYRGDVLVSNFNNKKNLQGTGTTIVEISPGGHRTQFARIKAAKLPGRCPGGVGLTTALVILRGGWVVVGSLPSKDGTAATARSGCLIVLDSQGQVRETISGHRINGPWDATAVQDGWNADVFVTNVLNGTVKAGGAVVHRGTVLRLTLRLSRHRAPRLVASTKIGSGFAERTDPAAFVVAPTGLGLGRRGVLYVADTALNRITAIPRAVTRHSSAGTGFVVSMPHTALNAPLGLAIAPGGNVLTVNGNNGRIVETTPGGVQVLRRLLDASGSPPGAGALFGLAIAPHGKGVYYVDDATNTLRLLH
jgi:hypothetical protein